MLALEILDGVDGVEMRNHGGLLSDGEANWPTDTIGKSPRSNTGEITGFLRLPYGTFGCHMIASRQNEGTQIQGLNAGQAGAHQCCPSTMAHDLLYPRHVNRSDWVASRCRTESSGRPVGRAEIGQYLAGDRLQRAELVRIERVVETDVADTQLRNAA